MKWFIGSVGVMVAMAVWSIGCSPYQSGQEPSTESSTTTENVGSDASGNPPESTGTENSAQETVTDTPASGSVPTNGADIIKFLEGGKYKSWAKESKVHAATLGSPHGPVQVYINDVLEQSLKAGNSTHPVGAASVKELYQSDMKTFSGYAVMVKATAGSGGGSWYWYEKIGTNVVADGTGAVICVGCHTPGKDFFRTEYPLK